MAGRLWVCLLGTVWLAAAQRAVPAKTKASKLTVERIMQGPGLYGWTPRDVRWSGDSQQVFFRWKQHGDPVMAEYSTWVAGRDGSGLRKLTEDEEREAPPLTGDDTRDWKLTLSADRGDIFLFDRMTGRRRQITKTRDIESQPRFTHDEKRIAFVRESNLYVLTPADGSIEQLTDIRPFGAKLEGDEKKGTESQQFLKKEDQTLLAIVRDREAKREREEARRKRLAPRKPFVLAKNQSVRALFLSPDETYVLAWMAESSDDTKKTSVPDFLAGGGYTSGLESRAKVGDRQAEEKIAFFDTGSGEVKWLKHDAANGNFASPMWSDDGARLILHARGAANKDEWILAVDPIAATARPLVHKHDDAWVDGPVPRGVGWVPNSNLVYFDWERDGWSHLYTVPFEGGDPKQLTRGEWEVRQIAIAPSRDRFLLTTSESHPGEDQLWELKFDGSGKKKLTQMPGGHTAVMSPDGSLLASIYSYVNKPPELYLLGADAKPIQVTSSPSDEFWAYPWLDVPLVTIPARDGRKVPARLYKPAAWKKGGPLVVFVHGAGYLQNAHRRWSTYAREYMFHHLLMERGFLVLDLDYRGSAGYGRDWRTAIYQHMGGKDLDDQVDAVKWAVAQHGVNPKRAGIYGGSYGGFLTLMALFTQPKVFQAGAALRPVTDWAHYNHGYTSNILNTPQKDPQAYRKSSPIHFAEGLEGALLICHGMVDVNVHFQDTVRLTQRLIELGKQNWELAVYPAEDHAFEQPASWADEYRRILKLFESNLRNQ